MIEIANDAVIPPSRQPVSQPERRLYQTMLHQSLLDLDSREHYNDAYRWLTDLSRHNNRTPDFIPMTLCCDVLGIPAESVARAVRDGLRIPKGKLYVNGYFTKVTGDALVAGKSWGL